MENEPQDAYMPSSETETLEPFDVRAQDSRRGMLILGGVFVLAVIFLFVLFKLFAAGTRDRDQTPRILADNRPYKEVPADPGGVQTPNQDKEIYDKINGEVKSEKVILTTPSEQPLANVKAEKPAANIVIKSPEVVKSVATPPVVKKPAATPKAPPSTVNTYVAQVASLRSQAEAEAMWDRLKIKMGATIKPGYYADIKRVDLETRGVYYRLRIAGVGDKEDAQALCTALEAKNQECFETKR